jgi:hypothetical protein
MVILSSLTDNPLFLFKWLSFLLLINDNPLLLIKWLSSLFNKWLFFILLSSSNFQQIIIFFSSRSLSLFHCENTATEDFKLLTMCPKLQFIKSITLFSTCINYRVEVVITRAKCCIFIRILVLHIGVLNILDYCKYTM